MTDLAVGKIRIEETALRLFVDKGLSVSTNAITREAGVATGLLYHHFSSKEELVLSLYSKCFAEMDNCTNRLFEEASENLGFEDYYDLSERSFWADVYWGVSNWRKAQYIALIDGALVSEQYALPDMPVVCERIKAFERFHQVGVALKYIVDLPTDYVIRVSRFLVFSATKLFHDNPALLEDDVMKREIRLRHWLAMGGLSPTG